MPRYSPTFFYKNNAGRLFNHYFKHFKKEANDHLGGWMMTEFLLILTTVPDADVGQAISETIIEERLAACVTIQATCQSLYWWKGKISKEKENTLFIKTKTDLFPPLEKRLKEIHPYDVPEIIALPVLMGSADYLGWIDSEIRTKGT
jgi:periplasmic divalent cation tolerance protein